MPSTATGERWELIATCTRGLEEVVRDELVALGHDEATCGRGMVTFRGGLGEMYRANVGLRAAMRVLRHLARGPAAGPEELYELASSVPWEAVFARSSTFAVTAAGRGRGFRSEAFAALTVKDAIADRLRSRWGERPDVDRQRPDLPVHLHLVGERADLALDSSGEPLSHRGYRPRGGPAPLAETLAAGILLLAGYDGSQPLLDPMAGTGTIAIEAALIAARRAPGLHRGFACERWPDHQPALLEAERARARAGERVVRLPIVAADRDPRAVAAIRRNAATAGVAGFVEAIQRDALELEAVPSGVIVCNPPYGVRLGDVAELTSFYRRFGDALKHRGAGATAWLLVGNPDLAKAIGLRPSRRIVLFNGPIECRLLRFDLYQGSTRESRGERGGQESSDPPQTE